MSSAATAVPVVKGSWNTSIDTTSGEYKRKESQFRNWITKDGEFKPEAGRYHLYVSYACPWAHRTLIVRALKGLEKVITYDTVDWFLDGTRGWTFNKSDDKTKGDRDSIHDFDRLRQVYELTDKEYQGNITVPVLFDKKTDRIVNNESSEIIQMLNDQFNDFSATKEQAALDLYPDALKASVDEVNAWVSERGNQHCGSSRAEVVC
jgi:putative glutathione S-transferase